MNRLQKESVFMLSLAALSVIVFLILSIAKFQAPYSAFAIFGISGLTPLIFYRKKKGDNGVILDERDKQIAEKAGKSGFVAFWVIFVIVAVVLPMIKGYNSSIPLDFLNKFLTIGMVLIFSIRAIKILWLYQQDKQ